MSTPNLFAYVFGEMFRPQAAAFGRPVVFSIGKGEILYIGVPENTLTSSDSGTGS